MKVSLEKHKKKQSKIKGLTLILKVIEIYMHINLKDLI